MKIKSLIFCLLGFIHIHFLYGQSSLYFRHLTIQQGISQNTITCILQDNYGFLWLGTEDGLNRYNGYDVDVYKHDPSDTRTISQSNIRCIFEDNYDVLWIGTDDGLNSYERNSEKFIHYVNDPKNPNSVSSNAISAITRDKSGILWVGTTNGLNSFDSKSNKWTVYRQNENNPASLSNNNISCMAVDKDDKLWIGTRGGGLNRFDISSKKCIVYKNDPVDERSISENTITAIFPDRSGTIWIGTVNEGLNKFDKASGTFIHYKNDPADEESISQNSVFSLCEDTQGLLWVGTLGGGLNTFNKATGKFYAYQNNLQNPASLSNNSIWSLYYDHAGALWIGTREGVNILDKRMKRFETVLPNPSSFNNSVYSICEDRQGTLWIGILGEGLISVEKGTGARKFYQNDASNNNSLSSNNVFSLCEDESGLLWIGTYDGLNSYDKKTGRFTRFYTVSGNSYSLSDNYVRALLYDDSGILWIGTYGGGLNSYDKSTGKFTRYKNDLQKNSSFSGNIVTCLFRDQSGTLWIGTYGDGLFSYTKADGIFTSYKNEPANGKSLSNNFIHCITEDRSGVLWIGTYGGGVNAFDRNQKTFSRYTERDGLSNNVINGIAPDVNGYLWLSTNKGLSKLKLESNSPGEKNIVRTYDSQDGAQNKYNEGAFFKSKTGKIFFGGAVGYNSFFPDEIKDNPYQPPVVITRFYLFEKPHTMDTMITSKRSVVLSNEQNFFSFEFAALNYTYPEKNQYAYMMEPLDKSWNYCSNRRYAAYTNIEPGDYTFRVKASNNDGVWNEQGTLLRITITPPFWKTWWFSIIAGIIVATSIVLYIRFRTRTLTKQNIVLEQKVEQRTSELKEKNEELVSTMNNLKSMQDQLIHSEKMASLGQLTAGIAHEIQNPLNFVNNFSKVSVELLEELKHAATEDKVAITEDLKTNLNKIAHHGERAERIVKGMLMHSRTGLSEKQPTDLNKLIEDSFNLAYTGIRANDNAFKCEVKTNFDSRIPFVNLVPQDLSRVMLNLINNSFYAMNEKKKNEPIYQPLLSLSTKLNDQQVFFKIADNGSGIPKENRERIFQPFFTTKPTGVGTGLGLSLSYDIITKRHGGEIKIESKEGVGTEFIITLPL